MAIYNKISKGGNGIPYVKACDSSADYASIPNSTRFKNLSDGIVYFKDSIGDIFDIFSGNLTSPVLDAAKAYADGLVIGLLQDCGVFTPSGSYPTTGGSGTGGVLVKGDLFEISGLAYGESQTVGSVIVQNGYTIRVLSVDTPGQIDANWAISTANFSGLQPVNGFTATVDVTRVGKWYKVAEYTLTTLSSASCSFKLIMNESGSSIGGGSSVEFDVILKNQSTSDRRFVNIRISQFHAHNEFLLANFDVLWNNTTEVLSFYYKPTNTYMSTSWSLIGSQPFASPIRINWVNEYLGVTTLVSETSDTIYEKNINTVTTGGLIWINNQTTGVASYYTTLELARDASVSGDTIFVGPGTYTVTTTDNTGLAKNGLNWFFYPGSIVNKATTGDTFKNQSFTVSCNIYGRAIFNNTGSAGNIYTTTNSLNVIFECYYSTNSVTHILYLAGNSSKFQLDCHSLTSSGGMAIYISGAYVELDAKFHTLKSTASNAIGGGLNQVKMSLNGNLVQSTTSIAIADILNFSQVVSNVANVLGVTYGFSSPQSAPVSLTINGNTTGVLMTAGACYMNGNCYFVNTTGADARFIGGVVDLITCSGGYIETSWIGIETSSAFNISAGLVRVKFPIKGVNSRLGFSVTGSGKLILDGDYTENYYTRSRVINGSTAEVVINGDFISTNTGSEAYGGMFLLQNGTLRIRGRVKAPSTLVNEPCVLWSGGKLIIENNAKLITTHSGIPPIVMSNPDLVLKIMGMLHVNYASETYDILSAKKKHVKYSITNVAATNLTVNLGAAINESDTTTYNTKALLAERMKNLINASYANTSVIAYYTAADEFFTLEALVAGTTYVTGSESNLGLWTLISNSYAMTDLTDGVIVQNSYVE